MAKKSILAITLILILAIFLGSFLFNASVVNIYIDGENVTAHTTAFHDNNEINAEICEYTFEVMENPNGNITTLREGIKNICSQHGIDNSEINIDSSIGSNSIPMVFNVEGRSMIPTLQDGQKILINKTKNVNVGDIVVADSPVYGNIVKRVDKIEGNEIYLISDNKNIEYENKGGIIYQRKGITTWVDYSNIFGVVIEY